jgi:hypothetical protein
LPIQGLHRIIIQAALAAVRRKGIDGVALGGGNALIARAGSHRPTEDIDVFVRDPANVSAASTEIIEAIEQAGYRVEREDPGQFGGFWDEVAEFHVKLLVTAPGGHGEEVEVEVSHFEYDRDEDLPGLGRVLSLDDIGGFKTKAVAERMAPRDFVDYAVLRDQGYTAERLFELARARDPGLGPADYADAVRHLDRMADSRLAPYLAPGLGRDAAWVRQAFAGWSRDDRRTG